MFRSATFKLTFSYLAIITLLCVMFSATIYHFATNELHYSLDRQSRRLVLDFPGFNFNPALRPDADYEDSSHRILLRLVYFNLLVLVVAGFTSYGLARRTLRPIEAAHEQQKRFTADVSHELRTPLTALKMTSEVALMDSAATKSALRQALTSNIEESGKLELLINNLLRLTRLEAAELQEQFGAVDISAVMKEAVSATAELAALKHIRLAVADQGAPEARGDFGSLVQLVTILLDNAVKYSPAGTTVKLQPLTSREHTGFKVSDQGVGIEAKDLPHIFDRFYRADEARTSAPDGSSFGLGLSIARMITELHHGRLHVTSQPGKGTTISVELPKS